MHVISGELKLKYDVNVLNVTWPPQAHLFAHRVPNYCCFGNLMNL